MADDILIRPAGKEDIGGMADVLSELLRIENETVDPEAIKRGFGLLMSDPERYCIYVAEKDGEIVGMCQAQSLISVDEGAYVSYIENVIVSGKLRSSGLGAKLMAAVENVCRERGHVRVTLLVLAKNIKGIQFYERNGWTRADHQYMEKEFI